MPIKKVPEDAWESVRFKSFPGDSNVQPGLGTTDTEQWFSKFNERRHCPSMNANICKAYYSKGLGVLEIFKKNIPMILMQLLIGHTLRYIDMSWIYHSVCFMRVNQESHLLENSDMPVLFMVLLNPHLFSDTRGFELLENCKSNILTHFTHLWQKSGWLWAIHPQRLDSTTRRKAQTF